MGNLAVGIAAVGRQRAMLASTRAAAADMPGARIVFIGEAGALSASEIDSIMDGCMPPSAIPTIQENT